MTSFCYERLFVLKAANLLQNCVYSPDSFIRAVSGPGALGSGLFWSIDLGAFRALCIATLISVGVSQNPAHITPIQGFYSEKNSGFLQKTRFLAPLDTGKTHYLLS